VDPTAENGVPDGHDVLFVVHADGRLDPITIDRTMVPQAGVTLVLLGPAPNSR
jgi:hypothetical protein